MFKIIITFLILADFSFLVFGEGNAPISDFPYYVQLGLIGYHLCGAVLIHPQILLTAEYCIKNEFLEFATARIGTSVVNLGRQNSRIVTSVLPPTVFNGNGIQWEAPNSALIFLNFPVELNAKAQVISLANTKPIPGTKGVLTGYGQEYMHVPKILSANEQELLTEKVVIVPDNECHNIYDQFDEKQNICALIVDGSTAIFDDKGACLVVNDQLIGVVLLNKGISYPAVFTFVGAYRKGIENTIGMIVSENPSIVN